MAHRIHVVGAGVAGLAAALYLHRAGHNVIVFERFDQAQPVGSGLMLQPTGLTVLSDLGLADAVMARGRLIRGLFGQAAGSGRTVLNVHYRKGRIGLGTHRTVLFDVLHEAAVADGIEIVTGSDVVRVEETPAGAQLIDGEGRAVGEPADLVIDASGARSALVQQTAPNLRTKELAYGAWWATLDWHGDGLAPDMLQQVYDRASVMIGVLPLGHPDRDGQERAAFFWSLKPADADAVMSAGLDAWKREVLSHWPLVQPFLDQISGFEDLTLARYGHRTLPTPYSGRLVHIGDSAHTTSPQLGQGANMALLDARALAYALSLTGKVEDALKLYARSRRLHIRVFQAMSLALTPLYQSDNIVLPTLRDTLVATLAKAWPMPDILSSLVSGTLVDPFRRIGLMEERFNS